MKKERRNFTLSTVEIEQLEAESKRLGIAMSDLVRRALDRYFEEQGITGKNVTFNIDGSQVVFSGMSFLAASGTKNII